MKAFAISTSTLRKVRLLTLQETISCIEFTVAYIVCAAFDSRTKPGQKVKEVLQGRVNMIT